MVCAKEDSAWATRSILDAIDQDSVDSRAARKLARERDELWETMDLGVTDMSRAARLERYHAMEAAATKINVQLEALRTARAARFERLHDAVRALLDVTEEPSEEDPDALRAVPSELAASRLLRSPAAQLEIRLRRDRPERWTVPVLDDALFARLAQQLPLDEAIRRRMAAVIDALRTMASESNVLSRVHAPFGDASRVMDRHGNLALAAIDAGLPAQSHGAACAVIAQHSDAMIAAARRYDVDEIEASLLADGWCPDGESDASPTGERQALRETALEHALQLVDAAAAARAAVMQRVADELRNTLDAASFERIERVHRWGASPGVVDYRTQAAQLMDALIDRAADALEPLRLTLDA
ncbi:MAG: hypothetical protein SGJ11_02505 [Phycisphaerae bacterium]|nr:hypothetical protein [Phycisphaerae bacterium]